MVRWNGLKTMHGELLIVLKIVFVCLALLSLFVAAPHIILWLEGLGAAAKPAEEPELGDEVEPARDPKKDPLCFDCGHPKSEHSPCSPMGCELCGCWRTPGASWKAK